MAGILEHSYLRSELNDTNSVRARALVGVLLSDLKSDEKIARFSKILGQDPLVPEFPAAKSWMCGIKPGLRTALYVLESNSKMKAIEGAVEACKKGENSGIPTMPDIPGLPGFPGMGGAGDFGPGRDCKETKVLCEEVLTSEKKKSCEMESSFVDKIYRGLGRTNLEAQKEAINQCLSYEGSEARCYDFGKMRCH